MKRNHVYDFSSFYSGTFPVILVFYAAFYWRIYLCFLHFNNSVQQIFWHCPFLLSLHLAGHNRRWIDTGTIDWYYWSSLLPIVSILWLKIVHFWPIVSIIGLKKNYFFDRIEPSAQDFFSSKDHRSNRCFLQ